MPAIQGSISVKRFRLTGPLPGDPGGIFSKHLRAHRFFPIDPDSDEEISAGWVSCTDQDDGDLTPGKIVFGDRLVVSMRVDVLKPAAKDVKRVVKAKMREFEIERQGTMGRREKRLLKAQVIRELRRRAVPRTKTVDLAWDLSLHAQIGLGRGYLFSTGKGDLERFCDLFERTFGPLGIEADLEGPTRWALDDMPAGSVSMEPTRELIFGFPGTRPGVLVELPDNDQGASSDEGDGDAPF